MYRLLRSILFWFDPEWVHYFSMNGLRLICRVGLFRKWLAAAFRPPTPMSFKLFDLSFPNRVGLGAGFDKNAIYLRELEALGFGFVEIGTVTPFGQVGNDKPRLFRLPKDKALINRMGFNNDGVEKVRKRLDKWKISQEKKIGSGSIRRMIIGGNIGKNKTTANDDAWRDYATCFTALFDYVDYFVVNVSSPNTPGLRELQEKESLRKILTHLQSLNDAHLSSKPILLKIAPDLEWSQIDDVVDLAMEIKLDGLVAANTTISRAGLNTTAESLATIGAGGLSGLPLKERSSEVVKYISKKTEGKLPIIASGGIFTGTDAKEKFSDGASLVQVWTGFIYEGPGIVKNICKTIKE